MNLYLCADLKKYFSEHSPLFDQMMSLRGKCFRHQEGRSTQRILLGEKSYFIKQHTGIGWKEIIKNIFQGRLPVLSASNEWRAIQKLNAVGISAPKIVGYGQKGINPARLKSFILMEALTATISLEELTATWGENPPAFSLKKNLIQKVAYIAKHMHALGMNHRDFYLCHFLLDEAAQEKKPMLYLIDLHRAQMRKNVPERWKIKDLAGLYFSSKDIGLTQRDLWRFMRVYTNKSIRQILNTDSYFWQKIKKRGERLYSDHNQ